MIRRRKAADELARATGVATLEIAVALCRGLAGVMLAHPDDAEPEHAFALLRYAAQLEEADQS